MKENICSKIETLAFHGIPIDQIAAALNVDVSKYSACVARGRVKARILSSELILKQALDGDTAAILAWAKSRTEERDTHVSDDGLSKEDFDAVLAAADY